MYIIRALMLLLSTPIFVGAQVSLDEVMYDMEGSDSKREWVEVVNTSGSTIQFDSWKFFENGTNHGLTIHSGDGSLSVNERAIIADNPVSFLADNPGVTCDVYDSSFSLSNTGETIAIRDPDKVDVDVVAYVSDQGAQGDGASLQNIDGSWVASLPTPCAQNIFNEVIPEDIATEEQSSSADTSDQNSTVYSQPVIETIHANAKANMTQVVTGSLVQFNASVTGLTGEPIDSARFLWSFGDGSTIEGKEVLHAYVYPGSYVVSMSASSGKYEDSIRLKISVTDAKISIEEVQNGSEGFIALKNEGGFDVDVSRWKLKVGDNLFMIPDGTYLAAHSRAVFPSSNTKLSVLDGDVVSLRYPNGKVVVSGSSEESDDEGAPVEKIGKFIAPISTTKTISTPPPVLEVQSTQSSIPAVTTQNDPTPLPDSDNQEVATGDMKTTGPSSISAALHHSVKALSATGLWSVSEEPTLYVPESASAQEGAGNRLYLWLLGSMGIALVSASGVLLTRSNSGSDASNPYAYEIIDVSDEEK